MMKFGISDELGRERAFKMWEVFRNGSGGPKDDISLFLNLISDEVRRFWGKRLPRIKSWKPLVSLKIFCQRMFYLKLTNLTKIPGLLLSDRSG